MTIRSLPDEILLRIFDFYVDELGGHDNDWWHTLVHVCRNWRNAVFASPRRLNLQLRCTYKRSVRKMLHIWPELPVIIENYSDGTVKGADNVVSALTLNARVSWIKLWRVSSSDLERFAAVMQDPFPALTDLQLTSSDETAPVISDAFLGGSAPRLQSLDFDGIPFPALPNLLLSATDLVDLHLWNIPHSGYFSPEAMVTSLSTMTRLKDLSLLFKSPRSRPSLASRLLPPVIRTVLPALTRLRFKGVTEYLEDLVAGIEVPSLAYIEIRFFNQLVFEISQLPMFLCRTAMLPAIDQANVVFDKFRIVVTLSSSLETEAVDPTRLKLGISCRKLDWQLSSLAQVCNSCIPTLSSLKYLDIREGRRSPRHWQDDLENIQWLELLQPFTTIQNFHLSQEFARHVAPALKELAGEPEVVEVLPALREFFLDGLRLSGTVQEAIEHFVAARQLSGHPVAIHRYLEGKE